MVKIIECQYPAGEELNPGDLVYERDGKLYKVPKLAGCMVDDKHMIVPTMNTYSDLINKWATLPD